MHQLGYLLLDQMGSGILHRIESLEVIIAEDLVVVGHSTRHVIIVCVYDLG